MPFVGDVAPRLAFFRETPGKHRQAANAMPAPARLRIDSFGIQNHRIDDVRRTAITVAERLCYVKAVARQRAPNSIGFRKSVPSPVGYASASLHSFYFRRVDVWRLAWDLSQILSYHRIGKRQLQFAGTWDIDSFLIQINQLQDCRSIQRDRDRSNREGRCKPLHDALSERSVARRMFR